MIFSHKKNGKFINNTSENLILLERRFSKKLSLAFVITSTTSLFFKNSLTNRIILSNKLSKYGN